MLCEMALEGSADSLTLSIVAYMVGAILLSLRWITKNDGSIWSIEKYLSHSM